MKAPSDLCLVENPCCLRDAIVSCGCLPNNNEEKCISLCFACDCLITFVSTNYVFEWI